jgi:hypothetical protein
MPLDLGQADRPAVVCESIQHRLMGRTFAPNARMKKILTDAIGITNAAAHSIVWYPRVDGTLQGIEV